MLQTYIVSISIENRDMFIVHFNQFRLKVMKRNSRKLLVYGMKERMKGSNSIIMK